MLVQTTDPQSVIQEISLAINQALQNGSVLWLISGGSNINLAVQIRKDLDIHNELTVGLIDERYGAVGHANSNWQQLLDAGFDENELSTIPVLTGLSLDDETTRYDRALSEAFTSHDAVIGIFGMGADGHTSGILPASPAVDAHDMVTSYEGPDYLRITTTPPSFKLFDIAYLVAFGDNKQIQLQQLVHKHLSIGHQPAQALKSAKRLVIYTDQVLTEGF